MQVSDIYNISESLSRHFLVEEAAREHLEKCLRHIKAKMGQLRHKLVEFGTKLDDILERVIKERFPRWVLDNCEAGLPDE